MYQNGISLRGNWQYCIDEDDTGLKNSFYNNSFENTCILPGSTGTNKIGEFEYTNTDTLSKDAVKRLRQRNKYVGVMWYKSSFCVCEEALSKNAFLYLERVMFSSMVFVNGKNAGYKTSLCTPHVYNITELLTKGENSIVIRVDNRDCENIGIYPSAYTDEAQTIWNGIVGEIKVEFKDEAYIESLKVFTDIHTKSIYGKIYINSNICINTKLQFNLKSSGENITTVCNPISIEKGLNSYNFNIPVEGSINLWDEFCPNLYDFSVGISDMGLSEQTMQIGYREIKSEGRNILLNGRPLFLRGNIDSCIYPITGFPPATEAEYEMIFGKAKDYGLNHIRFHSWCPPQAAFDAANRLGLYLLVEGPVWLDNWMNFPLGSKPEHYMYIHEEAERIINTYGNNPSFCMFSNGNEINGDFNILKKIAKELKDSRFLFTLTSNWDRKITEYDDYFVGQSINDVGLRGQYFLDDLVEGTFLNYNDAVAEEDIPIITHEVGQYCVFPDINEIDLYNGVLYPANFIAIKTEMQKNGLLKYHDKFLYASAKLSAMLYKDEIEAALRTEGLAGFQLLALHDFPGQSTATVGILNALWGEKGAVTKEEFTNSCNCVTPLAILEKRIYKNTEILKGAVKIANYYSDSIENSLVVLNVSDETDIVFTKQTYINLEIGLNSVFEFSFDLSSVKEAKHLTIAASVNDIYVNNWSIWVYPEYSRVQLPPYVCTDYLTLEERLLNGETVLFIPPSKQIKRCLRGSFFPVFWSPVHFECKDACGLYINNSHNIFGSFPTADYGQYQWKMLLESSVSIEIDDVDIEPITLVVPNYFYMNKRTNLFEANVSNGKLIVCTLDILKDDVTAKALRESIFSYVESGVTPTQSLSVDELHNLFKVEQETKEDMRPNIALNKPTTASSKKSQINDSSYGNDGNNMTFWCAKDAENGHWWQVDLGEVYDISGTSITFCHEANYKYVLSVSTDGVNWETAVNDTGQIERFIYRENNFTASAKYVRIVFTTLQSGIWASLKDFRVFN